MKLLILGGSKWLPQAIASAEVLQQFERVFVPLDTPDEELLRLGADAGIMIVDSMAPVSGDVIRAMPNLKLIHTDGVGYQAIDTAAAKERKICVCNCKGINAKAVAEHAVMLMLGLLRDVKGGDCGVREGRQLSIKSGYMGSGSLRELGECTVGLIGFGDIGKALANLLKAFGSRVVYYDAFRQQPEAEAAYGVTYLPQDELLAESDIVSLHVPVLDSTRYMGNAAFFAKMKKGAYLINTARGELVDTPALLDALRDGQLAAAALDCIDHEPVLPDNPILHAGAEIERRLLLSCHIAGVTGSTLKRGLAVICANVERLLTGEPLANVVNTWDSSAL